MINFLSNATLPKWLLVCITSVFSVIISIRTALIGLGIFILIDLYTGVKKYIYLHDIKVEWSKTFLLTIRSGGLRDSYNKAGEYLFTILMIAIFEAMVLGVTTIELQGRTFTISELAVVIACAIEAWSLFENREVYKKTNPLKKMLRFMLNIRKLIKK